MADARVGRGPTTRTRATVLLGQMRELLAAIESGELPAGPAYRHRVEGAVTALEAVLGLAPSLADPIGPPREPTPGTERK